LARGSNTSADFFESVPYKTIVLLIATAVLGYSIGVHNGATDEKIEHSTEINTLTTQHAKELREQTDKTHDAEKKCDEERLQRFDQAYNEFQKHK
jgi:hypothetical protein